MIQKHVTPETEKLTVMLEGAILSANPTATFTIIQDDLDQDTFNILYKHDEIHPDMFEELTNFRFMVFYVGKHPEGLQFRVKAATWYGGK